MSKAITCICFLSSVIIFQQSFSQDSTLTSSQPQAIIQNPIAPVVKKEMRLEKAENPFAFKKIILPTALIAYGVATLKSGGLQSLNREVKEQVWEDNPHKQFHLDNYLQWSPAIAVYGLNLVGVKGKNNLVDRTIIYGISQAIMTSTVFAVKSIGAETRPDGSNNASFPSGHAANAFAAAEFLRREYKDVSPWYGVAGYAVATTTGFLRMYNNKHWLSDVAAGAGIGILSTDLAYYIYPKLKGLFNKKKDSNKITMISPFYQQGALGLVLVKHF